MYDNIKMFPSVTITVLLVMHSYLKYAYGKISPSFNPKVAANRLLTSLMTSASFQVELMAILPVKPASVSLARLSPLGIGIALLGLGAFSKQTMFLFTIFCLVLALDVFCLFGGADTEHLFCK